MSSQALGIYFKKVELMERSYIKLPVLRPMPDSRSKLRKFSDTIWKEFVLFFILKYYKEVNEIEVISIIENEKKQNRAKIEKALIDNK